MTDASRAGFGQSGDFFPGAIALRYDGYYGEAQPLLKAAYAPGMRVFGLMHAETVRLGNIWLLRKGGCIAGAAGGEGN